MGTVHNRMINRLLANYLLEALEDENLIYGNSDLVKVMNIHKLASEDRDSLIAAAKIKLRTLKKTSVPFGPKVLHWIKELNDCNEMNKTEQTIWDNFGK